MNHEEIANLLDDYVDGTLEPELAALVDSHQAECSSCRGEVEALRAVLAEAARLPRTIQPPRDLWPHIHARIDSSMERTGFGRRTLWSSRYPLAAAAVLLVAVSSMVTAVLLSDRTTSPATSVGSAAVESPQALALVAQWRAAESEYLRATTELAEALLGAENTLPPETVGLLRDNLRIIDGAIRESRAALSLEPTNRDLMTMLSATYEKKLEVLQQVNRLSAGL